MTCDAFNLLFLSRIDPKKNIEGLLQALRLVRAKNLERDVEYRRRRRCEIHQRRSNRSRAILRSTSMSTGWAIVEGEEKGEVLAAASAFVLPSYSENFGIAVAEALAAGLPCVVSRGVAISDEIEKAGAGIVIGTTPEEIAAGLERLMGDRSGLSVEIRRSAHAGHEYIFD